MVVNSPQVSLKKWNRMIEMYREGLYGSDVANAINLYRYFHAEIRGPANKRLAPGQPPIPDIRAIDIYLHCHDHIKEPTNQHWYEIQQLVEMKNGVYRAMWKPVRTIEGEVIQVPRSKEIKDFISVLTALRTHRRCEPTSFFGYNPTYAVTLTNANPFANHNRPWLVENMPDAMKQLTSTGIGIKKARGG